MGKQESIFDLAGEEKLGLFVYWLNKRLLFLLLLLLLHYIFTTTFTTTNLQSTSYGLGNRIWGSPLSRYNSKSINCYRKQQIIMLQIIAPRGHGYSTGDFFSTFQYII